MSLNPDIEKILDKLKENNILVNFNFSTDLKSNIKSKFIIFPNNLKIIKIITFVTKLFNMKNDESLYLFHEVGKKKKMISPNIKLSQLKNNNKEKFINIYCSKHQSYG